MTGSVTNHYAEVAVPGQLQITVRAAQGELEARPSRHRPPSSTGGARGRMTVSLPDKADLAKRLCRDDRLSDAQCRVGMALLFTFHNTTTWPVQSEVSPDSGGEQHIPRNSA
jgi:hypothetical protein